MQLMCISEYIEDLIELLLTSSIGGETRVRMAWIVMAKINLFIKNASSRVCKQP